MSREDQFVIHLSIGGRDCGTWDRLSGGDTDSDDTKYRPGGTPDQISLGGPKTVSNVTLSRLFQRGRDTSLLPFLQAQVGRGACVVSKQPVDDDYNAFGQPLVYTGKLKQCSPPDSNSESNDAAMLALEISSATAVAT